MANVSRRYETFLRKRVHHTNTSSMSGGSTTSLFYRDLGLSREEARRLWAKILGAEPAVFPCLDLIICAICRSLRTAVWECSASETERRPDRTRSKTDRSTSLGSRKPRVRGREIPPPPGFYTLIRTHLNDRLLADCCASNASLQHLLHVRIMYALSATARVVRARRRFVHLVLSRARSTPPAPPALGFARASPRDGQIAIAHP